MKRLLQASIVLAGLVIIGCTVRSVSVGYYDDRPRYYDDVYVDRVYLHDSNDCYWDGHRVVVLKSGHRHHRGCGHRWTGRYWVIDGHDVPDIVIHKAPARHAHESHGRVHEPAVRVHKAPAPGHGTPARVHKAPPRVP